MCVNNPERIKLKKRGHFMLSNNMYSGSVIGFGNTAAVMTKRLGETINPDKFMATTIRMQQEGKKQISRDIGEGLATLKALPEKRGYVLRISSPYNVNNIKAEYPISNQGKILAEHRVTEDSIALRGINLKEVDANNRNNTSVHNFFATA